LPNPNLAKIVMVTKDLEARERVKARLDRAIAAGALPEARVRTDRFVFGPPVGFPVQFRVVGRDPMQVRAIAEQVRTVMAANDKVIDPHLNWTEQQKSIRLEVDQDSAKANGALIAVLPIMAVVMLGLLMVQLQSFSRLALVFLTAPLGLIGATGALLASHRPFGFVALLGLIALAGMIMRNSVILV